MIKKIASVLAIGLLAAGLQGTVAQASTSAAPNPGAPVYTAPSDVLPPINGGTPPKAVKGAKFQAGGKKMEKRRPTLPGEPTTKVACAKCYNWSGGYQTVPNLGLGAYISVQKPFLASAAQDGASAHSLGEIYVADNSGNAVEVGWIVDRTLNGSCTPSPACKDDPFLFVFSWKNGVGQGYNTNFVDYAPTALNAGGNVASYVGGTADAFLIQYFSGNWWVKLNADWIGYFPGSNWTAPAFTQGQSYQAFGEVAATDTQPCSDMGNGKMGYPYTTGQAKQQGATGQGIAPATTSMTLNPPNTAGYGADWITGGVGIAYTYGGPGWASNHTTAPGNTGSC